MTRLEDTKRLEIRVTTMVIEPLMPILLQTVG